MEKLDESFQSNINMYNMLIIKEILRIKETRAKNNINRKAALSRLQLSIGLPATNYKMDSMTHIFLTDRELGQTKSDIKHQPSSKQINLYYYFLCTKDEAQMVAMRHTKSTSQFDSRN